MSLPPIVPITLAFQNDKSKQYQYTADSDNPTSPSAFKLPKLPNGSLVIEQGRSHEGKNASPRRPETSDLESPTLEDRTVLNKSPGYDNKYFEFKLPQILSIPDKADHYKQYVNKWKRARKLNELKRTESTYEYYVGSPSLEAKLSKLNINRAQTHTAFLLPVTHTLEKRAKKRKKKKKENRSPTKGSKSSDEEENAESPKRFSRINNSSFEKIIEENESHLSDSCSSRDSVVSIYDSV